MKFSYYPGCSLEGTAREYGESTEAVAEALGIELQELKDWTCCGASSAHSVDHKLDVALSARNLDIAKRAGMDVVVPCAACYQRLKVAEKARLADEGAVTNGFRIRHAVDFFWDDVGEEAIATKVKKPLAGLNPVSYYGCLITRPPRITDARNPEDPREMDKLLRSLGANVKEWSYKTDCCGGSLVLTRTDIARKLTQKLLDMAAEAGADCIVSACPMCQSNLDMRQKELSGESGKEYHTPIFYFTELMGLAFGHPSTGKWLGRHLTDPRPLLMGKGLI
ncbi:MAG: CoB--CoM heterodisulfide reductase iron-sulfur subunit B family protein [Chloroflexi bacterium]|nr:CoB--CoM heterodisulfide reductase iron-sulfur subunit B family protein [Chloroflexota bacterium]